MKIWQKKKEKDQNHNKNIRSGKKTNKRSAGRDFFYVKVEDFPKKYKAPPMCWCACSAVAFYILHDNSNSWLCFSLHDLQGHKRPSYYLSLVTKMVVQFDEKNFIIINNISRTTESSRFREIDFTKKNCPPTSSGDGLQRPVIVWPISLNSLQFLTNFYMVALPVLSLRL